MVTFLKGSRASSHLSHVGLLLIYFERSRKGPGSPKQVL